VSYVETAAIDGETNLKMKLPAFNVPDSVQSTSTFKISKDKTEFTGPLDALK
jgi:magnesium-transporting ATPase (P-type)